MWPEWITEALKQGGLFAVAVICLAWSTVFFRMWKGERAYSREQSEANQSQAMKMTEAVNKMAEAGERQADAIETLADQVQRTREEDLRSRIDRKGAG
jgi:hypothetical protein